MFSAGMDLAATLGVMGVLGRLRKSVDRLREHVLMPSMVAYPFNFAMLSHTGRVRKGNEDTCDASIEAGAFVVCDGMGGAAGGEIASRLAAETFLVALAGDEEQAADTPQARIERAINLANQVVFERARKQPELRGMGTTLVALLHTPGADGELGTLTLGHVGDSRCYRFRDGTLRQLTADHSLVEEQVRAGELTALEAEHHPWRNIITRAVGSQAAVEVDLHQLDPEPGDLYLLASDGLTRELTDADIAAIIAEAYERGRTRPMLAESAAEASSTMRMRAANGEDVERIREKVSGFDLASLSQTLIDEANEAGGGDNITVLLLAIKQS